MRIVFNYTNHRNLSEQRTVTPIAIEYLTRPGFGYEEGWFLRAFCHDREQERTFSLDAKHMQPCVIGHDGANRLIDFGTPSGKTSAGR
jgi:predicted DNA-binding transcriptional regulator YafY